MNQELAFNSPLRLIRSSIIRRCNANERCRFIGRSAVWAFACKREFQTDLIQAFIALRYRELDLFSSDPLRLTFASQKLVFTETLFWLLFRLS